MGKWSPADPNKIGSTLYFGDQLTVERFAGYNRLMRSSDPCVDWFEPAVSDFHAYMAFIDVSLPFLKTESRILINSTPHLFCIEGILEATDSAEILSFSPLITQSWTCNGVQKHPKRCQEKFELG